MIQNNKAVVAGVVAGVVAVVIGAFVVRNKRRAAVKGCTRSR